MKRPGIHRAKSGLPKVGVTWPDYARGRQLVGELLEAFPVGLLQELAYKLLVYPRSICRLFTPTGLRYVIES